MAFTRIDHPDTCRRAAGWLLLWAALLLSPPAPAQTVGPEPIALHHASWTAGDGAPQAVLTMAQTSDGWLWLGGPNGLFRFDGARFERYAEPDAPLPANSISILSAQASGALWIGYRFGGASLLADGKIRNYDHHDGLPRSSAVWGLEQDGNGRMWAATTEGMFYLDSQRWHHADSGWVLGGITYKTLMRDRHGVLWAQGDQGIYSLAPGATRFDRRQSDSGLGVVMEVPDGSVWSWDSRLDRLLRLTPPEQGTPPRRWSLHGGVGALLFDRAGDLWAGRANGVEYHTALGLSQTGPQHGLSGGAVTAMLEDREGNIWAATANGVDRFRKKRIFSVSMPENPGAQSLAADSDGGMFTGRFHVAVPGDGPPVATALWPRSPVPLHNAVNKSYREPDGVLWTGGHGGLWRKEGAHIARVPLPGGITGGQFNGIARDRAGGLWIAMTLHGVFRLGSDGAWKKMDGINGLPDEPARAMVSAGQAGLWIGYPRSRVLRQLGDGWRSYGPAEGMRLGMVMTLHLQGDHVWAGGENGLALRQGERFIGVTGADGQGFQGVTGIVELPNGDLWLNAVSGLFRLPSAEIARLIASPGYRVRYQQLDSLDGLDGAAPLLVPSPSLALAADGWLWVSTTTGVFRFDPASRTPAPAPPVLIRRIGAPGQVRPATAGMRLAPGTGTLQVDYTAIALAMPERLRFRYRLEGVDAQWQEAGNRRAAYYNNLAAGGYRFQVQAANGDGAWDSAASTLEFSIAPTAIQSWWFRSLCVLALLAACWTAYRLRLRRLIAQMAGRMEERISERERIARELHDTLLQSVQGLILHVHAANMRLPEPEPARALIEQALQRADDVLHEGRDRVRDLRNSECEQSLAAALADAADHARTPDAPPLRLVVVGTPRKLRPLVHQEVLAIAAEAIANAYRHANASAIEAHLHYRTRELRLNIRDNGAGIPPEIMAAGGREHHWGLHGMRERARRIKARLVLRSDDGAGTECLLVVPGSLAYLARTRWSWLHRPADRPGQP
jgi:signal transduction histidine kinase